jgi:hypothetical protein
MCRFIADTHRVMRKDEANLKRGRELASQSWARSSPDAPRSTRMFGFTPKIAALGEACVALMRAPVPGAVAFVFDIAACWRSASDHASTRRGRPCRSRRIAGASTALRRGWRSRLWDSAGQLQRSRKLNWSIPLERARRRKARGARPEQQGDWAPRVPIPEQSRGDPAVESVPEGRGARWPE